MTRDRSMFNSAGDRIHATDEGVANFWRWFGESVATDDLGRPWVQYHGTGVDIEAFEPSTVGTFGPGIYTCDASAADAYAESAEHPRIIPVYLKLVHPYRVRIDEALQADLDLDAPGVSLIGELFQGGLYDHVLSDLRANGVLDARVQDALKAMGHDGIVATYYDGSQEWVVFDALQLKSARDNSGAFDPHTGSLTDDPPSRRYVAESFARNHAAHGSDRQLACEELSTQGYAPNDPIWDTVMTLEFCAAARIELDFEGGLS